MPHRRQAAFECPHDLPEQRNRPSRKISPGLFRAHWQRIKPRTALASRSHTATDFAVERQASLSGQMDRTHGVLSDQPLNHLLFERFSLVRGVG